MANVSSSNITLRTLPGRYAFCRLAATRAIPAWATGPAIGDGCISITRTAEELSILAPGHCVQDDRAVKIERGWIAIRVGLAGADALDFGLVGVLAKLTGALAEVGVPVCAISTFDADILLIKAEHLDRAMEAFGRAGFAVESAEETAGR